MAFNNTRIIQNKETSKSVSTLIPKLVDSLSLEISLASDFAFFLKIDLSDFKASLCMGDCSCSLTMAFKSE